MSAIREVTFGDRTVTRVGLGTNRLTNTEDNREFLRAAVTAGVDFIDTAHLYTDGDSERTIGAALAPFADDLLVATKGAYRAGEGKPEVLRDQIQQSFESLRTGRIGLYYLHRVDPETPLAQTLAVLAEYRDAGRIEHLGLSAVTVEEIQTAQETVPIAAVQNEYHLGDRRHDAVVDYCEREGILFVPYYPLRSVPEAAAEIGERVGATPTQVAVAWMLKRSPVVAPIPGTLSIAHLEENLAALDLDLSEEDFRKLAAG